MVKGLRGHHGRPSRGFCLPNRPGTHRSEPQRLDHLALCVDTMSAGTNVEHSYVINKLPSAPFKAFYGRMLPQHRDMRPQMADTLQSLRAQVGSES